MSHFLFYFFFSPGEGGRDSGINGPSDLPVVYAHESNTIKGPSVSISLTPTTGSGLHEQRGLFWPEQYEPSPGLLMPIEMGLQTPQQPRGAGPTGMDLALPHYDDPGRMVQLG